MNNITLKKPTGGTIKLGDIATLVKTTTPSKLTQEQGDYATTVSAKVTNKDVGGTTRQVMSKINNLDKPNNVKVNIGGASDDINNAMTQLAFAMLAAIIIVYLILVITFKGGLAPFYNFILFTIYSYRCNYCTINHRRNNISTKFNWYANVNWNRSNKCHCVNRPCH